MKKYFPIKLFYQITTVFFLSIFFLNFSIEAKDLTSECIAENGDGNEGICWFGEDWQEKKPTKAGPVTASGIGWFTSDTYFSWPGEITPKSCVVNTEKNLGKAKTDWLPYNYFCIGAQKYDTRVQGDNLDNPEYKPADPNSVWVECSKNPAPGIPVVNSSADLVERIITPKFSFAQSVIPTGDTFVTINTFIDNYNWTEIEYKQKKLPSNCKLCTGRTISSCKNWKKPSSTSPCKIQTSGTTCTFGNVDGKSANQNCANTIAPYEDRRVEKINGEDYTFFCGTKGRGTSQEGLVYRCKGKIIDPYEGVFFTEPKNPADPRSPKLYRSPRPKYNCDTTTEIKEQCDLKGGEQFNTSCIFGSYISTASDTKKNCAFDNQKFEYRDDGSYRHIVCTPNNVKYTCDNSVKNVPYTALFSPTFDTGKGAFDYQGTKITKKYDCKPYAPPAEETCTINTKVTKNGDCVVPVGCFKNNKPEKTKIGDEEVALYCMSKSGSNRLDGYIYYCPLNPDGTVKNYTDISVENNKYVYLSSFGSECKRYTDTFVNIKLRQSDKFSPLGLIKNISTFLYYFAIFYFIVLILINAFSYVRSGEDPSKLKQINESLFNTIAGFIFVLASGGVILYIINSFQ